MPARLLPAGRGTCLLLGASRTAASSLRLEPRAVVAQDLPPDHHAFVVAVEGAGAIGSRVIRAGQVAWLEPGTLASEVVLTGGDQGMRALLFGGKPLREPVAARGPFFVMNTEDELKAGFAESRARGERFGL